MSVNKIILFLWRKKMNAEEYSKRGDNYFAERNFDKAIADFTEVIKLEDRPSK